MTIPWLMNCPHKDDGWCLTCVAELGEERTVLMGALIDARNGLRNDFEPDNQSNVYKRVNAVILRYS